jgi:hypothetical protein
MVVLPLAPLLAVAGGGTALASPTSAARAAAALGEQAGALAVGLRVALLVGTALVAGLALVPWSVSGPPARALRVTGWVAAGVVAVAAEVVHLTGSVSVFGTVLQVVAALAAAALVGSRWAALPGVVLVGLLATQLGSVHTGLPFVLDAAYAVGAVALVGAAVRLAAGPGTSESRVVGSGGSGAESRRSRENAEAPTVSFAAVAPQPADRGGSRLVPTAIIGGLLATTAGLVQLLVSGPETSHDLLGSPYGLASLAAVALPLLAVVGVLVAARPDRHPAGELARIGAVVGGVGLAAASVLAALPPPGPAPVPGQPLLRTIASGGETRAVLVAPLRPGPNLVHVSGDFTGSPTDTTATTAAHHHGTTPAATATVAAGDAPPVPITARDGAGGGWAVVDLPQGKGTLTVSIDGGAAGSATVPVDAGTEAAAGDTALTGPDGPECASALLGDLAGQRPGTPAPEVTACPSDALAESDASALRATVRGITERGVDRIRLISDDSPRAVAAAAAVREAAPEADFVDRPDADSALVVVSGWATARSTLEDAGTRALETPTHLGGTYLAPWLLTPGVVTATASSVLPLTFDPQDTLSRTYAGAVAALFPGEPPATAGYLAWARHEGVPPADRPTLYGAAPVDVPMTSTGEHHAGTPNPAAWFPGGTVVPVSEPLS